IRHSLHATSSQFRSSERCQSFRKGTSNIPLTGTFTETSRPWPYKRNGRCQAMTKRFIACRRLSRLLHLSESRVHQQPFYRNSTGKCTECLFRGCPWRLEQFIRRLKRSCNGATHAIDPAFNRSLFLQRSRFRRWHRRRRKLHLIPEIG